MDNLYEEMMKKIENGMDMEGVKKENAKKLGELEELNKKMDVEREQCYKALGKSYYEFDKNNQLNEQDALNQLKEQSASIAELEAKALHNEELGKEIVAIEKQLEEDLLKAANVEETEIYIGEGKSEALLRDENQSCSCGEILQPNARFCSFCGQNVKELEEKRRAEKEKKEKETKKSECNACRKPLKENAKFCGFCGTLVEIPDKSSEKVQNPIPSICECGAVIKKNAKFCGKCGRPAS